METPYVETQALLAMLNDDPDEAQRLVRTMTRTEAQMLFTAARRLAWMAADWKSHPDSEHMLEQPS